jgi:hypothetical protein
MATRANGPGRLRVAPSFTLAERRLTCIGHEGKGVAAPCGYTRPLCESRAAMRQRAELRRPRVRMVHSPVAASDCFRGIPPAERYRLPERSGATACRCLRKRRQRVPREWSILPARRVAVRPTLPMHRVAIGGVIVATGGDPRLKLGLPVMNVVRRALTPRHRASAEIDREAHHPKRSRRRRRRWPLRRRSILRTADCASCGRFAGSGGSLTSGCCPARPPKRARCAPHRPP